MAIIPYESIARFKQQAAQRAAPGHSAMRTLIQRLHLTTAEARIVTFIAARAREGTSTVSFEYASALAAETQQNVLLIDASPTLPDALLTLGLEAGEGIADAMLTGQSPERAIRAAGPHLSVGYWLGRSENKSLACRMISDGKFWEALRAAFDIVVVAAPALQHSFDGVLMAAKSDVTVLVLEAEATPQAVVKNLRDTLAASGISLAGVVMNKRRYHIPHRVYQRL